jgi:hypothetical protein
MTIDSATGNVGIGTGFTSAKLAVAGTVLATELQVTGGNSLVGGNIRVVGNITVDRLGSSGGSPLCRNDSNHLITPCSPSSIRYKEQIAGFAPGFSLVSRLRPVSFRWKESGSADFGLIAEEVAEVEPLLVTRNDKGEIEGVKYDRVGVLLINVVKEQQAQIAAQEAQIKQQQEQTRQQQEQLESLKKLVCESHPQAEVCKMK